MNEHNELRGLFSRLEDIPDTFRLETQIYQRQILLDGELNEWSGPTQLVYSPMHIKNANGDDEKLVIGSYPLATDKEAKMALDAAVRAFGSGRGEWPSMSVQQRIKHLENFTDQMSAKKAIAET